MKGKVVLDSSVIVALFFKEDLSDKVEEVVENYTEFYTVSQAFSEVANAAWKEVRIYGEDENLSKLALKKAVEFMTNVCCVVDSKALLDQAFEIALKYDLTVYDALFVVLAMNLNEKLVTTDKQLWEKLKETELFHLIECIK
jgi:predicted nucleic acid-binding protein